MRGIWIDEGDRPDTPLLKRYGIDTVYMSARSDSEGVTAATFDQIRASGFKAGIYVGHLWDEDDGLTPEQSAERMNVQWLKFEGHKKLLSVMFNDETKDLSTIQRKLGRWRELRPFAQTSFSPEGFQGGLLVGIRHFLVSGRFLIVPQAYGGNMTAEEQWDTRGTTRDLTSYGWPEDLVVPFLDARHLRRGWELGNSVLFTQGRLPR